MRDERFPIVDQLLSAGSNRERAAQLLRLSDGLIFERGPEIRNACHTVQFAAGAGFVLARSMVVMSVRDAHGLIPRPIAQDAEAWRKAISDFAAGKGDGVPRE